MTTLKELNDRVDRLPFPYQQQSRARLAGVTDENVVHLGVRDADRALDLRLQEHGLLQLADHDVARGALLFLLKSMIPTNEYAGMPVPFADGFGRGLVVPYAGHRFRLIVMDAD